MQSLRLTAILLGSILAVAAGMAGGCRKPSPSGPIFQEEKQVSSPTISSGPDSQAKTPEWQALQRMITEQLQERGLRNERVLAAMARVPRHEFVPEHLRSQAYRDGPLPIGAGQTISQPYIVAYMTEIINPRPGQKALEIGTGSGYQAAVLAELVGEVYTIELIPDLAEKAKTLLKNLGYRNIHFRTGDGYRGWPEAAPFDAVVVTCGADHVPEPLFQQLKPGGAMIIPVGPTSWNQSLRLIRKGPKGEKEEQELLPVRFVPLRRGDPSAP